MSVISPLRSGGGALACALLLLASLTAAAPCSPARAEEEPRSVFCPVCGTRNSPGSRFCARDGTPLPEILPTRYRIDFVRALETYSPEEVQAAINRAADSVVRIRVKTEADHKYPVLVRFGVGNLTEEFGKMQTVKGESRAAGSGFASGPPGEIVTNAHVTSPFGATAQIAVETRDGRSFPARLLGIDRASDLALLKIESDTLPPLEWGDSDRVQIGDDTWAIGNPLDIGISLTRGTISSLTRLHAGLNQIENFIHSDATIAPGSSGGPLVDVLGRVVGVSDMGYFQSGGQGYSIPSNMARFVIERLRKSGKYERGFLGIHGRPVDEKSIQRFGVKRKNGFVVESVLAATPAAGAGFQPGDVLFGINGRQAASGYLLQEAISSLGPGAGAAMAVDRGGKVLEIQAVTTVRPEEPRIDPVADLERYLMARFEPDPKGKGVVIHVSDSFSVARKYGLDDGAVIQSALPAQDWPVTAVTFETLKAQAKKISVSNLEDLRTILRRAYVGGRIGVTFLLTTDGRDVHSVALDEEWPYIL